MDDVRRRIAALEADLKQSPVNGFGDPSEALLREAQQRLHELERELGATAPEK